MRILVASPFWPTRDNPVTGVFVVQQVAAFVALGCTVTVVVPENIRGLLRDRPYHQRVNKADVFAPRFFGIPQGLSGSDRAIARNALECGRAVVRTLDRQRLTGPFDAVHIHDVRYAGLAYRHWGGRISAPAILTLHGVDPFLSRRHWQSGLRWELQELWSRVQYVALVGRPLEPYAESLGAPPDRCRIVPNGSVLPTQWSDAQRPVTEKRVVLSVSNLVKLKGIDLNLQALSRIRERRPELNWEYRIVGDGPERPALQQIIDQLGLNDRVVFLGRLPHEATLTGIADADIFSLPSWGENFGIVYLEAMGRGRPVIGCRDWGAAEMVTDCVEGYLVEPKSVESLQSTLESCLTNPDVCRAMGTAGRAKALSFTWENNARSYLDLFQQAHAQCCQLVAAR